MNELWMQFSTVTLTVYSGLFTLGQVLGNSEDTVSNVVITILAGAVAVLWKKIEANYKKLEASNKQLGIDLSIANSKIDECELDRNRIKEELIELKAHFQTYKDNLK